ncbi:uncharacterized protein RJT20DRAFT_130181 [Scheffersomyces xylosifermentans]|uniref:uncharacterized protein n=1 Tax=Scheffersomyces xylosifermentans TaxID=1304137 RepID=UPI00315D3A53
MQFSKVLVPAAFVAAVSAGNITVTTEVVVTDFTTYCPLPTSVVVNNKTITVTEATTLTITGPCTIPTTYVTSAAETSSAKETVAPEVTTHEGAGNKVAVGAIAGVAAVAAALF